MAKEKYHNNQEITAISQEKTTCRRLHKAIIYRLVWDPYAWKWNFYRFNKNMETWLVQAEKGDSQLVICVFVSESNTYFSFHLKLFMLLS